jgi:hypothetical protein
MTLPIGTPLSWTGAPIFRPFTDPEKCITNRFDLSKQAAAPECKDSDHRQCSSTEDKGADQGLVDLLSSWDHILVF